MIDAFFRLRYTHLVEKKKIRFWDPPAGFCLLLLVFITAFSLELTYWTYNLNQLTAIALLSVIFGLLIGQSSFSKKTARVLIWLYGSAILAWQLLFALSDDPLWMNRLAEFGNRVAKACDQLSRNVPLEDGILFLTLIGGLFCFAGLWSGFQLTRTGKLCYPAAVFVMAFYTIQFFLPESQRKYEMIVAFSAICIFWISRLHYLSTRAAWEKRMVREDKNSSSAMMKAVAVFALFLTLFAFGLPWVFAEMVDEEEKHGSMQREYTTSWETLKNFLFPLRQQAGFGEGRFGDVIALGTARSLKADEVFTVQVPEGISDSARYYWRGRVYADYQNGYWQNSDIQTEPIEDPAWESDGLYAILRGDYLFTYKDPSRTVLTPPLLYAVERPVQITYFLSEAGAWDVLAITDGQLVHGGESVLVEGALNQPTLNALRAAGEDYPREIREHYLSIPPGLSENIEALARELSAGEKTPFDGALKITNYLRSTYRYRNYVKIPPDEDALEWFLFKGKEGYCNYFATAEVILLRSAGIPARFVAGYAQGERQDDSATFKVQVKDGHAWAEVYFPGIGWVILEPTPLQPSLDYPESTASDAAQEMIDPRERFALLNGSAEAVADRSAFQQIEAKYSEEPQIIQDEKTLMDVLPWLLLALLLPLLVWLAVQIFILRVEQNRLPILLQERMRQHGHACPRWLEAWARVERTSEVEKMYARIRRLARLAGPKAGGQETAAEFLKRTFAFIGLALEDSDRFIDAFHRAVYGKIQQGSPAELHGIYRAIIRKICKKAVSSTRDSIALRWKIMRFG